MRIASDYTTRANYQENYRKANRDAINERKRKWRKAKKEIKSESPQHQIEGTPANFDRYIAGDR